jgi:hypothetical protein
MKPHRRQVLAQLALSWLAVVAVAPASGTQARKPNILFICSDDHAAHAIGAYGGRLASLNPTPTIDRLAREGMVLRNVFSANAICVPSRATERRRTTATGCISCITTCPAHYGIRTKDYKLIFF